MRLFGRARAAEPAAAVQTVPGGRGGAFSGALDRYQAAGMERKLYDTLRLTVPIIDAAVCKIVRLTGGVSVQCESRRAREDLNRFLESVQVNACGTGIETFLGIYLEQLLTYGTALGEIVVSQDGKEISGLYNASLDDVELRTGDSPLDRLTGGVSVQCESRRAREDLNRFLESVQVNACGTGIETFLGIYLEQLLTYGTALGEIVVSQDGKEISGLYNASLDDVELRTGDSPLELKIYSRDGAGNWLLVQRPELIAVSTLSPRPGELLGESVLKGLPFVSSVLLKIYNSMGLNWERVGNVRFAVTYQPGDGNERAYTKERAIQIAQEWRKAMKSGGDISDFVAVGNVKIQTIGADNQILDSEVPVRQMLEQIIAKLSIPPFLLGLSWSTTERMSAQQADILTSELEAYRRILNPVIGKVCSLWLRLHGYSPEHTVVWDDINLQDAVELSNARLLEARAKQIEQELEPEREPEAPLEGGTQ